MTSRTDKMFAYKTEYFTLLNVNPGTKVPQLFFEGNDCVLGSYFRRVSKLPRRCKYLRLMIL
jgi:hypothetical protein